LTIAAMRFSLPQLVATLFPKWVVGPEGQAKLFHPIIWFSNDYENGMGREMTNKLPSMIGLRAFEAAARHLSFTRAAVELNLTQSAISHQIRNLGELIGFPLFVREGSEIRMTERGIEYLGPARTAIIDLQVATDRARGHREDNELTIACSGTFALKCLFPHLGDFIAHHPDIRLRVRTIVPSQPMRPDDYDVSIQCGQETDWPGFEVHRISTDEIFPVCSPKLCHGPHGLRRPTDLARFPVVRTQSPWILRDDWSLWLSKAGIADMRFASEISCDLLYPSFQAAIEGIGVALGRSAVVKSDLASGRLVEPFNIRLPSPIGFHLVHPRHRKIPEKVRHFVEWSLDVLAGSYIES
jgi:LysR family transcriptional regulator, glycine cleavage system transcriptional activator